MKKILAVNKNLSSCYEIFVAFEKVFAWIIWCCDNNALTAYNNDWCNWQSILITGFNENAALIIIPLKFHVLKLAFSVISVIDSYAVLVSIRSINYLKLLFYYLLHGKLFTERILFQFSRSLSVANFCFYISRFRSLSQWWKNTFIFLHLI